MFLLTGIVEYFNLKIIKPLLSKIYNLHRRVCFVFKGHLRLNGLTLGSSDKLLLFFFRFGEDHMTPLHLKWTPKVKCGQLKTLNML